MFEIWTAQDEPLIKIRFLNSYLNLFLGGSSLIYGIRADNELETLPLITIRGDGQLSPTDELMSTDFMTVTITGKNTENTTLKDFLNIPIFRELNQAFSTVPEVCKSCCWERCCGGGGITNRFSLNNRFNNPSIYCEGLKVFYSSLFQYLISCGIPSNEIQERLIN